MIDLTIVLSVAAGIWLYKLSHAVVAVVVGFLFPSLFDRR